MIIWIAWQLFVHLMAAIGLLSFVGIYFEAREEREIRKRNRQI